MSLQHIYKNTFHQYVVEAQQKMSPTKSLILPHIVGKDIIDWGSGPGHRAKILSAWGASTVRCWDPNVWCSYVFDKYYSSNQMTWIVEPDNLFCDTLYISGVTGYVGPKPHEWFDDVLSRVNCKYVVAVWDVENDDSRRLEKHMLTHQDSWTFFNTCGFNTTINGYEIYTSNSKLELINFYEIPKTFSFSKLITSIKIIILQVKV